MESQAFSDWYIGNTDWNPPPPEPWMGFVALICIVILVYLWSPF